MAFNKTARDFVREQIDIGVKAGDRSVLDVFLFLSDVENQGIHQTRERLGRDGWLEALAKAERFGIQLEN